MIHHDRLRTAALAALAGALALVAGCGSAHGPAGMATGDSAAPLGSPAAGFFFEDGEASDYDEFVVLERSRSATPARDGAGSVTMELFQEEQVLPGTGELRSNVNGVPGVRLPLERTDVHLDVLGPIVNGRVRQRFGNPYDAPIEAVYVFPLPHDAAVHDFVLTVGERRIRGVVREAEEARRIYESARAQGYTASLLTQQRPNIFTQNVANIAPGRSIDVELAYLESVDHVDGWQQLAFPMVVGPRYNPVGWDHGVGAAARGTSTGQPTDVTYLRPEERSGHDVALTVDLRPGVGIEQIASPTHGVTVEERPGAGDAAGTAVVRLAAAEAIPNEDFVLRWRVGGNGVRAGLVRQEGHALLTVFPPDDLSRLPRRPMEHVFVVDTSGSMKGEPLAIVKRAMRAGLARMAPDDTFHLLKFSSSTSAMDAQPLLANAKNLRRARRWIDQLGAGGGTEMLRALRSALGRPSDGERPRVVTFFTDGYIGNEEQILAAIQTRTADARVFAFGIGSSPNRWLMAEMAKRSDGAAAFVGLDQDPAPELAAFFDRASRPAVRDLRLSWTGARGAVAAEVPGELLIGRPLVLPVALQGRSGALSVRVEGRVDGSWRSLAHVSATDAGETEGGVLAKVWARGRLTQLAADARVAPRRERAELGERMRDLALRHGLVSSFTSFIAVDSAQAANDGGEPDRVEVAVPVPAGVPYDTTVSGS